MNDEVRQTTLWYELQRRSQLDGTTVHLYSSDRAQMRSNADVRPDKGLTTSVSMKVSLLRCTFGKTGWLHAALLSMYETPRMDGGLQ